MQNLLLFNLNHYTPSRLLYGICGVVCCCLALSFTGCKDDPQELPEGNRSGDFLGNSPAVSHLRIVVLDDPELVGALNRWQYEWKTLSGGSYTVTSVQHALPQNWQHSQDVVIYPATLMGELVEQKTILPIRTRLLEQEEYVFEDVFSLLRDQVVRWEDKAYAISMGSPVFTLAYRADILEARGQSVPRTWEEYEELVEYFSEPENWGDALPAEGVTWQPTVEPLAEGWAGHLFLARAASYARHRNQISTLFDRTNMQPLVDTPPYERALKELAFVFGPLSIKADPPAALAALQTGRCVFALTWAQPAGAELEVAPPEQVSTEKQRIAFTELPGSSGAYNLSSEQWEETSGVYEDRATYLGLSGRVGSVSQSTRNAPSAMRLLAWLTRPHASEQISAASSATTLFRRSQVATPAAWVSDTIDSRSAREYTRCVDMSLSRQIFLLGPRLPGASEYMEALDNAVRSALLKKTKPKEALETASKQWEALNAKHGLESQHAAYLHSLGQELQPSPSTE